MATRWTISRTSAAKVGNALQKSLLPQIKPIVDGLADWIDKNTEVAATLAKITAVPPLLAGSGIAGAVAAGIATKAVGLTYAAGAVPGAIAAAGATGLGLLGFAKYVQGKEAAENAEQTGIYVDPDSGFAIAWPRGNGDRSGVSGSGSVALKIPPLLSSLNKPPPGAKPQDEQQKVSVEVTLKNADPGTQVTARSSDGTYLPTRVEYAMPSMVGVP